jgi:hypothetical protein
MEKISWTNCVRNKHYRVKKEMGILNTVKGIGHILGGNCLVIQGKIEVAERQGGRRGQQLDDLRLYVLRGSDQRARASMRVRAIGAFVSYVRATG